MIFKQYLKINRIIVFDFLSENFQQVSNKRIADFWHLVLISKPVVFYKRFPFFFTNLEQKKILKVFERNSNYFPDSSETRRRNSFNKNRNKQIKASFFFEVLNRIREFIMHN